MGKWRTLGAHEDQVMTVLMLFFLLGVLSRRIMHNPLSSVIQRGTCVCVTRADWCAHGMLIFTTLVDPRRILRAHSALPLPPRCHGLLRNVGI